MNKTPTCTERVLTVTGHEKLSLLKLFTWKNVRTFNRVEHELVSLCSLVRKRLILSLSLIILG